MVDVCVRQSTRHGTHKSRQEQSLNKQNEKKTKGRRERLIGCAHVQLLTLR
jgi:hypothetical protein